MWLGIHEQHTMIDNVRAQLQIGASSHTCIHTNMHSHLHECRHTYVYAHAYTHARTHPRTHTHGHTHAHTHGHTHTHTWTHTSSHLGPQLSGLSLVSMLLQYKREYYSVTTKLKNLMQKCVYTYLYSIFLQCHYIRTYIIVVDGATKN